MARFNARELLAKLAEDKPIRAGILAARKARSISVSKSRTCPACGEHSYSGRSKDDICEDCLVDLWSTQDATAMATSAAAGEGMTAYISVTPDRAHDLPYPGFAGTQRHIPQGAVFDLGVNFDSPARTMQQLYAELFAAFAAAYPAPAGAKPETFLASRSAWAIANHTAVLPTRAAEILLAIWSFMIWLSNDSYAAGLDDGADILRNLNEGNLSELAFVESMQSKRRRLAEATTEAAGGGKGVR